MYIERVVLSRIKGFEKLDLDFRAAGDHAGWCVVTGNNGSGKTALLRALSLAILGPEHARTLVPDLRGWVADGSDSGTISVELKPHHDYDTTARGGHPLKGSFWAEAEVSLDRATGTVAAADVFRKKRKSALNGPWSNNTQGWLAVAYGPFRRLYGNSPEAARLALLPGRIPRFATLFKEDATLDEGEKWLQDLQYKRLEEEDPQLLTVLEASNKLARLFSPTYSAPAAGTRAAYRAWRDDAVLRSQVIGANRSLRVALATLAEREPDTHPCRHLSK